MVSKKANRMVCQGLAHLQNREEAGPLWRAESKEDSEVQRAHGGAWPGKPD